MKDAIEILLDEHKVLFDAIEATKCVQEIKDIKVYRKEIFPFITFFIKYTDLYHHPKEENILYPLLLKLEKTIDKTIIRMITGNHSELDEIIYTAKSAYLNDENNKLKKSIQQYLKLLYRHIWRENLIVLVNLQYILSKEDNIKIRKQFNEIDLKGNKLKLKKDIYKLIDKIELYKTIKEKTPTSKIVYKKSKNP